jgi:hypothetical protein
MIEISNMQYLYASSLTKPNPTKPPERANDLLTPIRRGGNPPPPLRLLNLELRGQFLTPSGHDLSFILIFGNCYCSIVPPSDCRSSLSRAQP